MTCDHDWKRVDPVVVTVNDPLALAKGGQTYNAVCGHCGSKEWLHWPERAYAISCGRE
jgi:hypothetical protein